MYAWICKCWSMFTCFCFVICVYLYMHVCLCVFVFDLLFVSFSLCAHLFGYIFDLTYVCVWIVFVLCVFVYLGVCVCVFVYMCCIFPRESMLECIFCLFVYSLPFVIFFFMIYFDVFALVNNSFWNFLNVSL